MERPDFEVINKQLLTTFENHFELPKNKSSNVLITYNKTIGRAKLVEFVAVNHLNHNKY